MKKLLLFIMLVGCGHDDDSTLVAHELAWQAGKLNPVVLATQHNYVDPELKPYVGKVNFTIRFGKLDEDVAGVCHYNSITQYKEVVINRDHWEVFSECERRLVIAHELEHCVNQTKHSSKGLMAPVMDTEGFCSEDE